MSLFTNKTLLITGGTGSFGNAVLNRFLRTDIGEIRVFSRDEKKQDDMRHEFQARMPEVADKIKFYIGDVRDLESCRGAMHGVDYIFHAAALKQVPSCEFFPMEAVRTNVIGTDNVLTAAIEAGVECVICLSTDKAAYPINAMGITKAIEEKSAQAQRLCSEAAQDYAAVEAELLGTRADLSNKKQSLARMEAESRACENELSNSKLALQNFDKQIEEYTNKVNILSEDRKNAGEQLAQLNRRISEAEEKVNSITGSRAKMIEEREEIASQLQNVRLEIVTAQKDIDALNSEILFAENSSNNFGEKQRELNAQIEDYKNKNALIQKNIDELEAQIKDKSERIAEHNARISSINCEKDTYEKRSVELRTIERDKTSEREVSGRELSRLEERKINLQNQYDNIISKLWEEYELTKREAEEQAIEIPDSNAAQKRLNELKQKIKNLGNVNVSAIEEYKEVSERFEFMSTQVNDVEKSKREIERLITDLTKQMKEVFVESFEEINKNFTFTFKELFGGGTASLSLSEPEDILNSGIDIIVHPPGKIVVHLDALSGGEKALVAIALYFAIMKVRPAPFCVMDEIEAALDDVNVDRFANYMRNLTHTTQFICITHRRGTMEEADVLYGVTMQDEGVSKLLELRSTEIAEKLGIKAN